MEGLLGLKLGPTLAYQLKDYVSEHGQVVFKEENVVIYNHKSDGLFFYLLEYKDTWVLDVVGTKQWVYRCGDLDISDTKLSELI